MKMRFTYKFILMQIEPISVRKILTGTHFKTEAEDNSEMAYSSNVMITFCFWTCRILDPENIP